MICSDPNDLTCKLKGMTMNRDDAVRQAYGTSLAGAQGQQADMIAEQMRGFGDGEMQQAATLVDQNMDMGLLAGDAAQQVASSMPGAPKSANVDLGGFDFKGLGKALGALSAEEPYQHNMTLQYGGGKAAPVQAAMPEAPQQQPDMSQAMNAIKMTNMLYGAPQQQPQQQQQQPSLMRSLYGF